MSQTIPPRRYGRLPRTFDAGMPHMSALISARRPTFHPPEEFSYLSKIQRPLGMMMNDILGDCTCAGFYHALQVWTSMNPDRGQFTVDDHTVELMYEEVAGFDPTKPLTTDKGAVEQHVLSYLMKTGAPTTPDGKDRHKILGAVEVDRRMEIDVRQALYDCGVLYIGFAVPQSLEQYATPPKLWQVDHANPAVTGGGHCVVLTGVNPMGYELISWGDTFIMTRDFFNMYVDEVYAISDPAWLDNTGKTLLGMNAQELADQMRYYA